MESRPTARNARGRSNPQATLLLLDVSHPNNDNNNSNDTKHSRTCCTGSTNMGDDDHERTAGTVHRNVRARHSSPNLEDLEPAVTTTTTTTTTMIVAKYTDRHEETTSIATTIGTSAVVSDFNAYQKPLWTSTDLIPNDAMIRQARHNVASCTTTTTTVSGSGGGGVEEQYGTPDNNVAAISLHRTVTTESPNHNDDNDIEAAATQQLVSLPPNHRYHQDSMEPYETVVPVQSIIQGHELQRVTTVIVNIDPQNATVSSYTLSTGST
jgi:hypothetical protein